MLATSFVSQSRSIRGLDQLALQNAQIKDLNASKGLKLAQALTEGQRLITETWKGKQTKWQAKVAEDLQKTTGDLYQFQLETSKQEMIQSRIETAFKTSKEQLAVFNLIADFENKQQQWKNLKADTKLKEANTYYQEKINELADQDIYINANQFYYIAQLLQELFGEDGSPTGAIGKTYRKAKKFNQKVNTHAAKNSQTRPFSPTNKF